MADEPEILTAEEARAGESRGKMRYVLAISVVLAVAVIVWLALGTDMGSDPRLDLANETGSAQADGK